MPAVDDPRILVDATAVPPDRRGVGRYVDSLLPALDAAGARLAVTCRAEDVGHYASLCPHADVLPAPAAIRRRPIRLAWEQTLLPALIARTAPDVVHCPHYTRPLAVLRPTVVTLHDATFFTHPEAWEPVKRRFFGTWTRASLRLATRCIVPSAATRDELVRILGVRRARIDVIHLGVDEVVFHRPSPAEIGRARDVLGIGDRPYVAFLGTLEPRKNVPALVRGFAAAVRDRAERPVLVLAGGTGWDGRLDEAIASVPRTVEIIRPGFLPGAALAGYLGGASVVAYPSLGEGFGLPVLEAMACGAAVLTTRHLALGEVGGDAVEYTETSADAIAAAIGRLLADAPRRAALAERGLKRAAAFRWDTAAAAHRAVYAEAAATSRGN